MEKKLLHQLPNIKAHLDDYLEFDSALLFKADFVTIFGGAIRDIVANQSDNINDIDILVLPKSNRYVCELLVNNGYKKYDLIKPNLVSIYKEIRYIFEPLTFINSNGKIVQLIRPTIHRGPDIEHMKIDYYKLLLNVDLTSSGLFYDGEDLYESVENSYILTKNRVTYKIPTAFMYDENRTYLRKRKLVDNGWDDSSGNKVVERSLKIDAIRQNMGEFLPIKTIANFKEKKRNILNANHEGRVWNVL